jgi:hypothetical protein
LRRELPAESAVASFAQDSRRLNFRMLNMSVFAPDCAWGQGTYEE